MDELNGKWKDAVHRETEIYERGNSIRGPFDRDYTRLLHCQAYRRLKHKTQVFFAPHNDHICTRMEHVGHVASVASTIARYLGLNDSLTQAIALGHDIGHAPFGHYGEDCLNTLLQNNENSGAPKKFWHERNSLFFADYIETLSDPNGNEKTLNLTYAVRDGLVCHCGEIDQKSIFPRKEAINLYDISRPGLTQPFTWEGCVVKIADKIAYLGRDIEDARTYHILDMGSYRQLKEIVGATLGFDADKNGSRSGKAVNTTTLINDMIFDLCQMSTPETGLNFSEKYFNFLIELKRFSFSNIYNHWRLLEFQKYAGLVLATIFRTLERTISFVQNGHLANALRHYPKLGRTFEEWLVKHSNYQIVESPFRKQMLHFETPAVFDVQDAESFKKCIIEFISGMTDDFAIEVYNEIISF